MKKRVLAVVMCALMAGTAFTGFKAAGDDKELVLFTWEGMFPQEVLDDFEKETGVKVVYSKEQPIKPKDDMSISRKNHCVCPPGTRKCTVKHQIPGSTAFVPPVVGMIIAGEVIKDLTSENNNK